MRGRLAVVGPGVKMVVSAADGLAMTKGVTRNLPSPPPEEHLLSYKLLRRLRVSFTAGPRAANDGDQAQGTFVLLAQLVVWLFYYAAWYMIDDCLIVYVN